MRKKGHYGQDINTQIWGWGYHWSGRKSEHTEQTLMSKQTKNIFISQKEGIS